MLFLFRKIRKSSIKSKQVVNYLFYAIGELFLVVAGILIALEINNRDMKRQQEEKIDNILVQLHEDLEDGILEADDLIEEYFYKDSLIQRVLTDQVTAEDYRTNPNYAFLVANFSIMPITKESYDYLMQNIDIIPEKYESLILELKPTFEALYTGVETLNEEMKNQVMDFNRYLKDNAEWFHQFFIDFTVPDVGIDYYMNDPMYKNECTYYRMLAIGNHMRLIEIFRSSAIANYKGLTEALELEDKVAKDSFFFMKPATDFEFLTGTYQDSIGTIEIALEEDELILIGTNSRNQIMPLDHRRFYLTNQPSICSIQRDSSKEVLSVTIKNMALTRVLEKQE